MQRTHKVMEELGIQESLLVEVRQLHKNSEGNPLAAIPSSIE
jgi:hypothetical protein